MVRFALARLACAGAAALLAPAAVASADFVITTPGSSWNTMAGQNFTPSVGGAPDPGLSAGDTVYLTGFTFTRGDPAGAGNAATRLVVLPGAYYDTNGDPNGSFTPTIADVTGISTNAVDTASAASGTALAFTFDDLALTYGDSYAVAFATVGAGDALSFHAVNAYYVNYEESPPGSGVYVPTSNYGGSGNYNASALYADSNGDGYFEADNNAADAAFTATFVVPEPGAVGLLGIGGLGLLARRRRR